MKIAVFGVIVLIVVGVIFMSISGEKEEKKEIAKTPITEEVKSSEITKEEIKTEPKIEEEVAKVAKTEETKVEKPTKTAKLKEIKEIKEETVIERKPFPTITELKNEYNKVIFDNVKIYGQGAGSNYTVDIVKSKAKSRKYILTLTDDVEHNQTIISTLESIGAINSDIADGLLVSKVQGNNQVPQKAMELPWNLIGLLMKTQIANGKYLTPEKSSSVANWTLKKYKDGFAVVIGDVE